MAKEGIKLDLRTIIKMREDFVALSKELRARLADTEDSIETVSHTWEDENFQKFRTKFNADKERLEPLFLRVDQFEQVFLKNVEEALRGYLGLNGNI